MLHRARTESRGYRAPSPMPLDAFCRAVGAALADASGKAAPALAARLLPDLLGNPALLTKEQRAVPTAGYGRSCIFACPHETYSVLAMVWPPGFTSPIHDHKTWCAFGVYEGVLGERRYAPASAAAGETCAMQIAALIHRPGAVAHLPPDAPDIHCMHNPTDRPAISIHVYGGDANRLGPNVAKVWTVEA